MVISRKNGADDMNKTLYLNIARVLLLLLAAGLLIFGAYNGRIKQTEGKGKVICLECIGLG